MIRLNDLVGQRFGHLVVRERTPYRGKHAGVYWLCECDCGGSKEVSSHNLRRGDVASCGCLRMSKSGKCSVKGCTTEASCKGLCFKHYQWARRHDGDTSDRPRITICTIEGCGRKVEAKGLCSKHYQRARRHGGETPIGHARITDSQPDQKARQAAGPGARADAASPRSLRGLIGRADSTGTHPQDDGGLLGPRPRTEVITDVTP
jgi:hypothetical protein